MKIVIFQPMLKFYRPPLFERLHKLLALNGHELRVVFGTPWTDEQKRNDNIIIETDYYFFQKSYWFFNSRFHILENSIRHIVWADIVITEQANKHLHNLFLVLFRFFKIKPFAYWGHGLNRQGNPYSFSERLKKILARQTDWWFAYSPGVADYLQDIGFSKHRISVLNNSVDTATFKQALINLTFNDIEEYKRQLKLADDAQIGLFCGSLHKDKKIGFLLDSAVRIKQENPRFILLIGGDGQDKILVEQYASRYEFIIYLGPLLGKKKNLAFKCSNVFLNPGMVGLGILDAFSAGLPLLTTKQAAHSPEIDYLKPGYNGMLSDTTMDDYVKLVLATLASAARLAILKENALASAMEFSIENMALNFSDGIEKFVSGISISVKPERISNP